MPSCERDDFLPRIDAKIPTKRVAEMPEQRRKPFCVIGLRGMVTSFCVDEAAVTFYEGIGSRNGGFATFEWSETDGRYVPKIGPTRGI